MKRRAIHPSEAGEREFRLILAFSLAFYALLGLFFQRVNIEHRIPHPAFPDAPPKTITLQLNPPREKPKLLPPPPPAPLKEPAKVSPRTSKKPEAPPAPPPPDPAALARKKSEEEARNKAREAEENREIARKKFASLFGSDSGELIPEKRVDVISTPKGNSENPKNGPPQRSASTPPDLQVKTEDIDELLKNLPAGNSGDNRKAVLGEHRTHSFSGAGGTGSGGNGRGGSTRSAEEVEKSFKAYEGRLRSYYDRTLQSHPDMKGVLVVRIIIAPDGRVLKCETVSSELNDKGFENEITRIIQEQFKFTVISGGEEYYDRALNFHPVR